MSATDFLKETKNPADFSENENHGVALKEDGFIDGDLGGNVGPIEYEKINPTAENFFCTEKQIFIDGTYKLIKWSGPNKVEVFDQEGNLENTIINDKGNVTQTIT